MISWLHGLPDGWLTLVVCGGLTAFTWGGIFVMRSWRRIDPVAGHVDNDLVSTFLSAFGVLLGLVLGLIAVETYSNHDEVDATVAREAAVLGTIYRDVMGYPEPTRSDLQAQLRAYCRFVIDVAWPLQERGEIPEGGAAIINRLSRELQAYEPKTSAAIALHEETLRQFDQFLELRRLRLHYVTTGLPPILWSVVVVGSLLSLSMTWFLVTRNLVLHLTLSGILATMIGLMIVLIMVVDWPFSGGLAVSPDAYEVIFRSVMSDQGS